MASYSEYLSSAGDQPITIESYLQEKEAWNEEKTSLWLQDEEGAYYIYHLPCSPKEYDALYVGRKLRVSGYKTEFSGNLQLTDAAFSCWTAHILQARSMPRIFWIPMNFTTIRISVSGSGI